jgi:hypothetical protein
VIEFGITFHHLSEGKERKKLRKTSPERHKPGRSVYMSLFQICHSFVAFFIEYFPTKFHLKIWDFSNKFLSLNKVSMAKIDVPTARVTIMRRQTFRIKELSVTDIFHGKHDKKHNTVILFKFVRR